MNHYEALKQRQQEEFSTFPMQYAFSDKQFAEGMAALGLKPTDTEETLDALGYTAEEVLGDPRLKRGIEKAVTEICKDK